MQTCACWTLVSLLLLAPVAGWAQERPSAPAAPGGAVAARPGPQAAEFARVLAQWKKLLADLGAMKEQYRSADSARRRMQKQWEQLIDRGTVLQDKLIDAAEKAYVEAPMRTGKWPICSSAC